MNLLLLGFFIVISGSVNAQISDSLGCPLKDGKIIINPGAANDNGYKRPYQVNILGADNNVCSISSGVVAGVHPSAEQKRFVIAVDYGNYTFIYDNLDSSKLAEGYHIRQGEFIGTLRSGEPLLFRVLKQGEDYIQPGKILPCRSVYKRD